MRTLNFYKQAVWVLCVVYAGSTNAQKLPNIQENSQWIPAAVKVDGNLSEWNNVLPAYNKATRVEYSIANDDKNLYFAIRSADSAVTAKILAGGVTLKINATGDKKDAIGPAITFPATNSGYSTAPSRDGKGRTEVSQNFTFLTDSTAIVNALRRLNEIKVLRFKGVVDSLLSIYNEHGIKTKLTFSNDVLTAEALIPLDLLGLSSTTSDFMYNVLLKGVPMQVPAGGPPPPPMGPPPGRDPGRYITRDEVRSPTDFSGKYTLARK